MNRREMLSNAAAFALLAAEIDSRGFAQAIQEAPRAGAVDVADYWTRFYDDTLTHKGANQAPLAKRSRQTLYLHCPDSGGALNYAQNLPKSVLPSINGDVQVKIAVSQYRPGKGDLSTDISHLRIDATQTFDYMDIVAPLSWATIASLTPDKLVGQIPSIDQIGFHEAAAAGPAAVKQITLPSGVGKFAVNVTRPASDTMTTIVKSASVTITAVLSMMTLPAISVPAVKVFSTLFGKWQSHATVIMNGNLTPVIATSVTPPNLVIPQDPMPLTNGYYVMFPAEHENDLKTEFPNLTLQNGYLVRKDAPPADDLDTRARAAVPGVSYATLRVYVDKATATGGCPAPKPA